NHVGPTVHANAGTARASIHTRRGQSSATTVSPLIPIAQHQQATRGIPPYSKPPAIPCRPMHPTQLCPPPPTKSHCNPSPPHAPANHERSRGANLRNSSRCERFLKSQTCLAHTISNAKRKCNSK